MEPSLRYVNHLGQEYDFHREKIWPLSESLYDFDVSYKLSNGRVAGHVFADREIPLSVAMNPRDAAIEMNLFYQVLMADVESDRPGRLYDGAWYIECLLKKHSKRYWYRDNDIRSYDLSLWSPDPTWYRDSAYVFTKHQNNSEWLTYPHPYPHSYSGSSPIGDLELDSLVDCDFGIEIFGAVTNPNVTIGENQYQVNVDVPEGASLEIDTKRGTVILTTEDGLEVDAFSSTADAPPGSGSYIFERLKPGSHYVSWDGSFDFAITVYEQGRERRWLN